MKTLITSILLLAGVSVFAADQPDDGIYLRAEGEVFEDKISLSKWFAFDKAGMLELHGSYCLDFNDPDDESWRTIWQDYVSADFTVRIKEDKETSNKAMDSDKK